MFRYFIAFAALLGLAACETVGGMGRDIETAGDAIEETARETEEEL